MHNILSFKYISLGKSNPTGKPWSNDVEKTFINQHFKMLFDHDVPHGEECLMCQLKYYYFH